MSLQGIIDFLVLWLHTIKLNHNCDRQKVKLFFLSPSLTFCHVWELSDENNLSFMKCVLVLLILTETNCVKNANSVLAMKLLSKNYFIIIQILPLKSPKSFIAANKNCLLINFKQNVSVYVHLKSCLILAIKNCKLQSVWNIVQLFLALTVSILNWI